MKKLTKGIAITIASAIIIGGGVYYSINKDTKFTAPTTPTTPSIQTNPIEEKIRIFKKGEIPGPGPLTKENVSLAGIHIGDSQEKVRKLYGEPTKQKQVNSTPYLGWYYENLGLYVTFFPNIGLRFLLKIPI